MSDTATAEVKPTAPAPTATAEVKPTVEADKNTATPEATAEKKPTGKSKEVILECKYAQVRIGTEYFSPDHEGTITVPAELATEAKRVLGL